MAAPDSSRTTPVSPTSAASPASGTAGCENTSLSPLEVCLDSRTFVSLYTDRPDSVRPVSLIVAEVVELEGRSKRAPEIVFMGALTPVSAVAAKVREKFCVPVDPPAPLETSPDRTTVAFRPAVATEFEDITEEDVAARAAEDDPPATLDPSEATTELLEEELTEDLIEEDTMEVSAYATEDSSEATTADREDPAIEDPVPPAAAASTASDPSTAKRTDARIAEASDAAMPHPLRPAARRLAFDCMIEADCAAKDAQSEL